MLILIALLAVAALFTAVLAHFRHNSFKDEAQAEIEVAKDYLEGEIDKLRAKIDGGTITK